MVILSLDDSLELARVSLKLIKMIVLENYTIFVGDLGKRIYKVKFVALAYT